MTQPRQLDSQFTPGSEASSRLPRRTLSARQRLSVMVAILAVWPVALTTTLGHDSGEMGFGAWSINEHNAINRPVALLAVTAAAMWLAAAALWSRPLRERWSLLAVTMAAGLAIACAVVILTAPPVRSLVPKSLFDRVRVGESESAVIAALGRAPDQGTGSRTGSDMSLSCLVYDDNALGPPIGQSAFCFRGQTLAVKLFNSGFIQAPVRVRAPVKASK